MANIAIAAIDFGTTFCSLSYLDPDKGSTEIFKISQTYDRVPTALLVKRNELEDMKFVEINIGYRAQSMYKNIPTARYKDYLYFECFKMQLRDDKLSRELLISAFAGEEYYIIEVIALVLQHLRKEFEKHLSTQVLLRKTTVKATDYHWVLTVPAIWEDGAKQMMREAAYKAGLLAQVPEITSFTVPPARLPVPNIPSAAMDKLVLALEPECAALYCQQLTNDMIATHCAFQGDDVMSNCYMVLDIGGGTVDIAIHTTMKKDSTTIESVLPPTGNDCGGMKVNREFSLLLQKIVGDNEFERFLGNSPGNEARNEAHYKAIITNNLTFQNFDDFVKVPFGSTKTEESYIRLDPKLATFYEKQLTSVKASRYGVQYEDDTIIIPYSKMEELFQPAVSGILSCMNSALSASPVSIDTIYLVGGFGGCPYIYRKVKEEVQKQGRNVHIIVPMHHKLAVVEGAVIFRQNMSAIKSRVSDAYYGIAVKKDYDANKHEYARRVYYQDDDCYLVDNVFDIFINKDQTVRFDEKFEKTFYPSISTNTSVSILIYRTTKDDVKYLKDVNGEAIPGIKEIGKFTVDAPISGLPKSKRNIEVEFLIGGTELQVKAVYGPTGKDADGAVLDFLSIY